MHKVEPGGKMGEAFGQTNKKGSVTRSTAWTNHFLLLKSKIKDLGDGSVLKENLSIQVGIPKVPITYQAGRYTLVVPEPGRQGQADSLEPA